MAKTYLTTTETANLLDVSPDTVLKWVKAGKIQSYRTPGGHCRIPRAVVSTLLPQGTSAVLDRRHLPEPLNHQFCWQFNSPEGDVAAECENCLVYKSRARRCYELNDVPEEAGFLKLHCKSTCDDCDYYRVMRGRGTAALLISKDTRFTSALRKETDKQGLQLQCVASEYECARTIEHFRPDYIIVDASFGSRRTGEICGHLSEDSRIPFTRLILTSRTRRDLDYCDRELFGWMRKPFSLQELHEYIEETRESAY